MRENFRDLLLNIGKTREEGDQHRREKRILKILVGGCCEREIILETGIDCGFLKTATLRTTTAWPIDEMTTSNLLDDCWKQFTRVVIIILSKRTI